MTQVCSVKSLAKRLGLFGIQPLKSMAGARNPKALGLFPAVPDRPFLTVTDATDAATGVDVEGHQGHHEVHGSPQQPRVGGELPDVGTDVGRREGQKGVPEEKLVRKKGQGLCLGLEGGGL